MANRIYNRRQFGSPSMLSERRATPENPSFNLNDPAAWAMLGAEPSASGVPVNHDSAMKVAAVWQAASMISGDIAKLHLSVYTDPDCINEDTAHPAFELVRWDWNDETIAFHGWRTIVLHALIWGNGYAFIDRNGRGDPVGLYTLLPDRVSVERHHGELFYVTETTREDGTPWLRPIPARDVYHLRGLSADGVSGLDWTKYARDCIGTALATEQFQAKYFKSGVRTGGILMIPREMKENAKNKLEEGFAKSYAGPDNWFKTVILRDGAKFEAAQSSLRDAQMVELEEGLVRKVGRFFNLAPSRLGLSDSVSYNSKSEDNQGYLDSTLSPWLIPIAGESRKKLLSQTSRDEKKHYFGHNTDELLRMNELQRYQVYAIAGQTRILTQNEMRKREGYAPVPGGDKFPEVAPTPSGGIDKGGDITPRGPADKSGGNAPASKMRQLVYGVTRYARHKSRNPKSFLTWIDSRFEDHHNEALALFGDRSLTDKWLDELRGIASTATESTLPTSIEAWAQRLESEA